MIMNDSVPLIYPGPAKNQITSGYLDACLEAIRWGRVGQAMDDLFASLHESRKNLTADQWKALVNAIRRHSIVKVLHDCAILGRAFAKPRGYPGDAVLIDYLYGTGGDRDITRGAIAISDRIYEYLFASPAARAVRHRRGRLAELIDIVQQRNQIPTIISLAAGHLREIELTRCHQKQMKGGRIVAVDHDPRSLEVIERYYAHLGVETCYANVKEVVTGKLALDRSEFIYAAGLFDYLARSFAQALAKVMFNSLNSGGRLLLANFAPDIRDSGFMEAIMDWWLIYRDENEISDLLKLIPRADIDTVQLYRDPDRQIVYLEAIKA